MSSGDFNFHVSFPCTQRTLYIGTDVNWHLSYRFLTGIGWMSDLIVKVCRKIFWAQIITKNRCENCKKLIKKPRVKILKKLSSNCIEKAHDIYGIVDCISRSMQSMVRHKFKFFCLPLREGKFVFIFKLVLSYAMSKLSSMCRQFFINKQLEKWKTEQLKNKCSLDMPRMGIKFVLTVSWSDGSSLFLLMETNIAFCRKNNALRILHVKWPTRYPLFAWKMLLRNHLSNTKTWTLIYFRAPPESTQTGWLPPRTSPIFWYLRRVPLKVQWNLEKSCEYPWQ